MADLPSDASSLRLRSNGVTVHAVAAGPEDGPLVILLHGFPEFWYGWRSQIGPLAAAGLRVLVPDQRGYNLSEKPAGRADYTLDQLAADVLGLADAVGRTRFAVVGHDWGGVVAWRLAATAPERVTRAAIVNAPHPATLRSFARRHPAQLVRSWYVGFFQVPLLPELVLRAANFALLRRSLGATARPGSFGAEDFGRYRAAWSQPGALTGMLNWYRALRLGARSELGGPVRPPIRVIWGDRDVYLDKGLAEAGAALCEQAAVFHRPDATHWVQHDEPERVSQLLLEFLLDGPPSVG